MERRRRPSIFDMMERYMERMFEEMRGLPLPFEEEFRRRRRESQDIEDWFRDPFEDLMERLEEELPKEFKNFVTEEETPEGKIRRYGPFIYGFTLTKEPGKEPEREPLVDLVEQKDSYEVVAELPGVEKKDIRLHATENSLEIRTENERKYYKEVTFDVPVDPKSAKATYKNGVLSVKIKKKEGGEKTTISLE